MCVFLFIKHTKTATTSATEKRFLQWNMKHTKHNLKMNIKPLTTRTHQHVSLHTDLNFKIHDGSCWLLSKTEGMKKMVAACF